MDYISVRSKRTGADRTVHWGILVAVTKRSYIVKFLEGAVEFPLPPEMDVHCRPIKSDEPIKLIQPGWKLKK
jgi:hypothetical protein